MLSSRLDLIKSNLKFTVKPLPDTRLESRIEAVEVVLLQLDDIVYVNSNTESVIHCIIACVV